MYLEQLANACGVSGDEGSVRKIILEAIKPHVDHWRIDAMGNLFATRNCRQPVDGPPLRVMVTAHMDEVGFLITRISGSGLLKFEPVGGFDPRVLLGKAVVVGPDKLPGVIGLKPIHLLNSGEYNKAVNIDAMSIDVGATGRADAKVNPGDFATFATQFGYLGGQPRRRKDRGRVKGKAFDNRVGCAILIELLRGDYPVDLIAVFTVQEEVGMRGAHVAAFAAHPDAALVLEATAADDLPALDEDAEPGLPRLDHGPAITVMDRSFIPDRRMVDALIEAATAAGLPYQFKRPGIGATDAGAVHLAREGIPAAVVSVPTRFIHGPVAVLELADFWRTHQLAATALRHLPGQTWLAPPA